MARTSSFLPLLITLLLAVIAAVVGYIVYAIVTEVSQTTSKKMEKHNITMSRDGMKVGVKERNNEHYTDRTQGVLMKVWNHASWPAYASPWLGWGSKDQKASQSTSSSGTSTSARKGNEQRNPYSRHSSSQQQVRRT